ncbi:MAG: type I secretion system permease/ATPase [Magnetococcales bacterium]|nr:type I secretion system permease/ATPase [Magnetococcales bacterium]
MTAEPDVAAPSTAEAAIPPAPLSDQEIRRRWPETDASQSVDDPLLHCLLVLTQYWQRPQTLSALRAGLPLVEGRFTPDLFVRAAERADIAARLVRKPMERISPLTLPAVLLLKDRQACLLMALEKNGRDARVIFPETGSGEAVVELERLAERYAGQALFARPTFRFDARSKEIEDVPDKHWFWGTLTRFTSLYAEAILASLMLNIFTLTSSLFAMNVYDRVVPNNAIETLWVLAIGATIVYGFDFIVRTLRSYLLDVAGKKADIIMASTLFHQISNVRMESQPASSGALARNLLEFESLRDFFTSATLSSFIDLPFVFLFLWVIYFLAGEVVLAPLMAVPLVLGASLFLQQPLARIMRKTAKESSQKHAILIETLNAMETVKTLNAEGNIQSKWEQMIGLAAQTGLQSRLVSNLIMNFSTFVQQMAYVGIIVFGVYQIQEGKLTMGALIASSMLTSRALAPLSQVAGLLMRFQQSLISLRTLNGIMKLPVERPVSSRFIHCPKLSGEIQFDNVSFSYPKHPVPIISNFSLHIRPGERIAILGRIGSGKSTLIKLMLNLYQPDSGTILMDGIDIQQIDPVDLRRNMGCVTQDSLLFFGSIRSNILIADPFADDQAMVRAARQAGVDELVSRHPHGFNRMVGEQGKGLSGGQRQTIAIARALLTNPPILLMDEPTSSMDGGSEERFKERMQAMQGKTVILVTHRASLLPLVDRVIVLEEGQILLDGPRQEVVERMSSGQQLRPPTASASLGQSAGGL